MKLIVCESCEAEFTIKHLMEELYYSIQYCPFCGEELTHDKEFEDDIIDWIDEYEE